ncbi:hypothetical protein M9458_055849 [Cirrhinus mrigala]|uniref:ribonuclease H n=1 Tax=Cirrhinus mrigala TaxID=683832 RepID=A0ABD0MGR5_CIRMR
MQYRQKPNESIDDFVPRARTLALKCQFTDDELNERLVELIIASTPFDALRNYLYSKPKGHPIADVLAQGRKYEALAAGNEQIQQLGMSNTGKVHTITRGRTCQNCDTNHKARQCLAHNETCSMCGNRSHWAKCCKKNRYQSHTNSRKDHKCKDEPSINAVDTTKDDDEYAYQKHFYSITISAKFMHSIHVKPPRDEAYTTLNVKPPFLQGHGYMLHLKIDTGASGNTLPLRTFRQMYGTLTQSMEHLKPASNVKLTSYTGDVIPCFGIINMPCQYKQSRWTDAKFYVVDVPGPAVVGLPTCELLSLVTVNVDAMTEKKNNAKEGKQTKESTQQHIKNIKELKEKYPDQFDKIGSFTGTAKLILKEGANPFVDPPRKCSIHIKDKLHNELNKLVNQGVLRKVEEHTDWCSSLAFSTKKDGSLRICLDPQKLNASLKRCPRKIPTLEELNPKFANAKVFSKLDAKAGYWSIHLDEESQILTTFRTPFGRYCWRRLPFGLSVSQDLFQAKMDQILEGLHGVISIADDVAIKASDQIQPKSKTYKKRQTPQSKDDLHRFMGTMNYLSPYIPKFADKAHSLRGLLRNDSQWMWDTDYQKCFEDLKSTVTVDACLKYYNPTTTLTLEVDASQRGIGVALVQDNRPIAFGSKTLTECQSRYSKIEREMLAIVYGMQQYHTYLYGKSFIVVTDHKPLVTICTMSLHAAPPRLQRMLIMMQGYNYSIVYRPGNQMILADTLSRLPNPENNEDIELDERIDGLDAEFEDPEHHTVAIKNFSPNKQEALRTETAKDPKLSALKEIIHQGWPDRIQDLPKDLRNYWPFRDELAIEAGVVFKGRQVLISESMTTDILTTCRPPSTCAEHQDAQPKELIPHKTPIKPWQYLSSDLFEIHGHQYLLTVDRYSKYPLVDEMPIPASSHAVAQKMQCYTPLFGRPDEIMTDNGPQYTGQPFKKFMADWGIKHTTSSPHYPKSNGFIERHVRQIKSIIKKTIQHKGDVQVALLQVRATPIDSDLPSPAELLLGRPVTTLLPSHADPGKLEHRQCLEKRTTIMKTHHDQCSGRNLPLFRGQSVRVLDKERRTWHPGTILGKMQRAKKLLGSNTKRKHNQTYQESSS